jgi:hypothetical protein
MRRRRKPTLQENLDTIREVEKLFGTARTFLAVVGSAFGLIFTYLQVKNISIVGAIQAFDPETLTRVALIIYYNCWIVASNLETKMAQSVYIADPNRGRIPLSMFLILPILLGLGGLLFFIQANEKYLSLAIAAFLIVDVSLWINVSRLARSMAARSASIYIEQGMYAGLERLRCYSRDYIRGRWQIYRYTAMACFLTIILVICHSDTARSQLATVLHLSLPDVTIQQFWALIPGVLFFSYICMAESWVWTMRLKAKRELTVIDELRSRYAFKPSMRVENLALSI